MSDEAKNPPEAPDLIDIVDRLGDIAAYAKALELAIGGAVHDRIEREALTELAMIVSDKVASLRADINVGNAPTRGLP
jgi:hypothetical protein